MSPLTIWQTLTKINTTKASKQSYHHKTASYIIAKIKALAWIKRHVGRIMKRASFKACASVVEVFQKSEKFILFDEIFLAEEFGKVT